MVSGSAKTKMLLALLGCSSGASVFSPELTSEWPVLTAYRRRPAVARGLRGKTVTWRPAWQLALAGFILTGPPSRDTMMKTGMAFVNLTKQIAQQALLDSLRSPDAAQVSESLKTERPAPAAAGNVSATILGQIQAMQKALKEDEELVILLHNGLETMRVLEVYVPSSNVAVLTGIDAERNLTRVIAPVENLQLICKVMKAQPAAKPVRVALIAPKPAG
jgi:hypothetical protein